MYLNVFLEILTKSINNIKPREKKSQIKLKNYQASPSLIGKAYEKSLAKIEEGLPLCKIKMSESDIEK